MNKKTNTPKSKNYLSTQIKAIIVFAVLIAVFVPLWYLVLAPDPTPQNSSNGGSTITVDYSVLDEATFLGTDEVVGKIDMDNNLIPNLMLAGNQRFTTLVVAVVRLQSMGGAGASQYNLMMAGTMLAMLPMLILFLCMNKMFVEGITQGAVKG